VTGIFPVIMKASEMIETWMYIPPEPDWTCEQKFPLLLGTETQLSRIQMHLN
jgi:hypothetical protein